MTKNTTPVTEDTPGAEICGGPYCKDGYFLPTKRARWSQHYCSYACAQADARDYEATERDKWAMYSEL